MTARRPRVPNLTFEVHTIPHVIPWGILYHYCLPLIPPDVLSPRPKLAHLADSLQPPRATPYWLRQWSNAIKPEFWFYIRVDDREDRRAIGDYYAYLARIKSRQSSDREAEHELEVLECRVLERWLRILALNCSSPTPRTSTDEKIDMRPEEELMPCGWGYVWPTSASLPATKRNTLVCLSDASEVAAKFAVPACSTEISDAAFEQVFGIPPAQALLPASTRSSCTPSRLTAETECETSAKVESISSTSPSTPPSTTSSTPYPIPSHIPSDPLSSTIEAAELPIESRVLAPERRLYPPALAPPARPSPAHHHVVSPRDSRDYSSGGGWLASLGSIFGGVGVEEAERKEED